MLVLVQHLVKQFGLPDATEQLSLFRLWLCENFIRRVSQRELKTRFQKLFESLSSIKKNSLGFLIQQSSLAFLGCGSVRILFSGCLRGN